MQGKKRRGLNSIEKRCSLSWSRPLFLDRYTCISFNLAIMIILVKERKIKFLRQKMRQLKRQKMIQTVLHRVWIKELQAQTKKSSQVPGQISRGKRPQLRRKSIFQKGTFTFSSRLSPVLKFWKQIQLGNKMTTPCSTTDLNSLCSWAPTPLTEWRASSSFSNSGTKSAHRSKNSSASSRSPLHRSATRWKQQMTKFTPLTSWQINSASTPWLSVMDIYQFIHLNLDRM